MNKSLAIRLSIACAIFAVLASVAFYLLKPKSMVSPISSVNLPTNIDISQNSPSEELKGYFDDSGFSFNYPNDIQIRKIDISDNTTYANLEFTSSKAKGSISIKIADTKLKSLDDWFGENKIASSGAIKKDIKIGEISGSQLQINNKIMALAINQEILFSIEVDHQNQKYWQTVYATILSSFNFVPQQSKIETETIPVEDSSNTDVVLEEEIIE